jgi:hypothetical protein
VIFELTSITLLRIELREAGGEIRNDHIGEDSTGRSNIETSESLVHHTLPNILAAAKKFRVDRTNLVEHLA